MERRYMLFKRMANYIIEEAAKNSDKNISNCSCIVPYADIQERFSADIEQFINEIICKELYKREEVLDVIEDTDGFDITIRNNQ